MTDFRELEQQYFNWKWNRDPVAASAIGLTKFDGKYADLTSDAITRDLVALKEFAEKISKSKVSSQSEAIDRQAILSEIQTAYFELETEQHHLRNPAYWVDHALSGLDVLIRDGREPDSLLGRLRSMPRFLDAARHTISKPVKLFSQVAKESIDGGLQLLEYLEENPLLTESALAAATALAQFSNDVEQWAETGLDEFAIGKERFNWYLANHYMLPYDTTELWQYGKEMKEAVETKLKLAAMYLGGSRDWPDVAERLREAHPSSDEVIDVYKQQMERAKEFVEAKDIVTFPQVPVDIIPTPAYMAPTTPFAAYTPPALYSDRRRGTFFVTVTEEEKRLRDHCSYEIPITALHEGYPGHHVQHIVAYSLPSLTRNFSATDLTVEGWALYCESMMGELGFYESIEEKFFQHIHMLWRACRVLLDVGLHTKGVSLNGAINFLQNTMHISRNNAAAEVKRYAMQPTQPMTYAIGRREIMRLRSDWMEARNSSLKEFHDTLLQYGGLPISLARQGMGL
jgi:uncharacterized protein (DUF885 family)